MKNKIKFVKLILSIMVFSISLIFTVFAEVEVEPTIDIYKSYEGWYKNFIVECGACRITLRNYDGSIINDYYVLPKQFENNTEITRIFVADGNADLKDNEGRTIMFMQKNDGKLNLNDYTYKALNGSELERKYSDNIPQLSNNYGSNKEELPYIYFEEFSRYTTVESWKEYNKGENVNKLATDLGINTASLCKNPIDNKEISFYEWVTTPNADGVSPTLELQPITLYPETTEQIYCNDFYTAQDYNLQWNSDMGAYCEELNKSGSNIFDKIGGFFDGIFMKIFGSKHIGIGDSTKIKTDHNKYVTIIQKIENYKKTFDLLLTLSNFLCSSYPKYGAGIIINGGATQSEATKATESEADPLTNDGYVLYEDELSYVYTYDDIGNEATRRLTGTNY